MNKSWGIAVLVVAALYWLQAVLIPMAMAILLTFLLSPLVGILQRRRLGRVPAVLVTRNGRRVEGSGRCIASTWERFEQRTVKRWPLDNPLCERHEPFLGELSPSSISGIPRILTKILQEQNTTHGWSKRRQR
jgi:hypothetical protein